LTQSGVTPGGIDSLRISLQQIASAGENNIVIDCGGIRSADISGLRLLYVWKQCARICGMELELVNLSDGLEQVIQRFGLGHGFTARMAGAHA